MKSIKNPLILEDYDISTIVEHSNKISVVTLRKFVDQWISSNSGKKPYFGYIEKNIATFHMSLFLKKHSPLNRAINYKIDQMIQSGIMQRLVDANFEDSAKIINKQNEEENQKEKPEQLTMEHLELCFCAVLIGLAVSFIVFALELLVGLFSSRRRD
jgi:hypothetical protein